MPPEFPTPFVVSRVEELGLGSGPWTRSDLIERWGESTANKFVQEAKNAGWLVSPSRATYFVPAAQDLAVVPWLSTDRRQEFLIGRTLASTGLRYWCLSAWLREQDIELGAPVFVTDLAPMPRKTPLTYDRPTMKELQARAKKQAASIPNLPYAENLLVVPEVAQTTNIGAPATALIENERLASPGAAGLTFGAMGATVGGLPGAAVGSLIGLALGFAAQSAEEAQTLRPEQVVYPVSPPIRDPAWLFALLASMGIPRVDERFPAMLSTNNEAAKTANKSKKVTNRQVREWAALFGAPEPNKDWRETILGGRFPFFFVPGSLWKEMGADQAIRRQRLLERMKAE